MCLTIADSRPHRYLCQSLGLSTVGSVEESAERISLVSYVGRKVKVIAELGVVPAFANTPWS